MLLNRLAPAYFNGDGVERLGKAMGAQGYAAFFHCNIKLEYRFPKGEIPEMRIFVQDNEFIDYRIPGF